MLKEFKEFITRGNVVDLAVGIIIGTAFTSIVNSLVNDIIMPPLGVLLGDVDFSELYINLSGKEYDSLAAAQEAGAATINYGLFINAIVSFLIVAFAVFWLVKIINQLEREKKEEAPSKPTTKECPYCLSSIAIQATRCPYCTSELVSGEVAKNGDEQGL